MLLLGIGLCQCHGRVPGIQGSHPEAESLGGSVAVVVAPHKDFGSL